MCSEWHRVLGCTSHPNQNISWDPNYHNKVSDIVQAQEVVRTSGLPIYLGARIPITTRLNVQAWKYHLAEYFDQQLGDLIYNLASLLSLIGPAFWAELKKKHTSAATFSQHVDKNINEELSVQALSGPFEKLPFRIYRSTLLRTRFQGKAGSDSKLIIDLS